MVLCEIPHCHHGVVEFIRLVVNVMTLSEIQQLQNDMLTNCRFCVVCGRELEVVGRHQRGCPDDHGFLQISDNTEGLPGAFFEFDNRLYQHSTP